MKAAKQALITGASSGIGQAMAVECANRGMRLALVALDTPDLKKTAEEIQNKYKVQVDFMGIDLTTDEAPY